MPLDAFSPASRSTPDQEPSASSDRPERSRNAKAQARHRAKRKAYIEQLEQTVTKLQYALSYTPEQVAALPQPVVRIRELEEENAMLRREVAELRHQLDVRNAQLRPDISRQGRALLDDRYSDRCDIKRRRTIDHPGDVYVV
ncbi:hypothetical protein K474DRAFT_1601681 [Panus rudis PR-1116 ss-1]|nr:hypothetical protein K474DRAFT_1601681 [Panus rudis PR-1116 ss-1]